MADNYRLDIIHDKEAVFKNAVQLAFDMQKKTSAFQWVLKDDWLLILAYSSSGTKTEKFFTESTPSMIADMCWQWLKKQQYPNEPDMDGSCKRGFRLSTASIPLGIPDTDKLEQCVIGMWNRPRDEAGAIFAVKPIWLLCGK